MLNSFKPISFQASIFTPSLNFTSGKIFAGLQQSFDTLFNGQPILIPLPPDIPKEVPVITLSSADNKFKLEVSQARLNFYRINTDESVMDSSDFISKFDLIVGEYLKLTSATVGRLALITTKCLETPIPAKELAEHFCKPGFLVEPFNRPENFEIHSHKKYSFNAIEVNSWVRCKTGLLRKENKPVIIVEQDLNTLAEDIEKKQYSIDEIKTFFERSFKEQQEILIKYFPIR